MFGIFSCVTPMAIPSAASNALQMRKKKEREKEKTTCVSHEVIAVFELMQHEVDDTITAILDCNMDLHKLLKKKEQQQLLMYILFSLIMGLTLLEMS